MSVIFAGILVLCPEIILQIQKYMEVTIGDKAAGRHKSNVE